MSASVANTAVYLTDTPKQVRVVLQSTYFNFQFYHILNLICVCYFIIAKIKDKINKHAFSGGKETLELQVHRHLKKLSVFILIIYKYYNDSANLEPI